MAAFLAACVARGEERARAPTRVTMSVEGCAAVLERGVWSTMSVELGSLPIEAEVSPGGDTEHVSIRCEGERARVIATGTRGSKPVERTLELDAFPGDAAPRALALAGVEALAAVSPEIQQRIEARQNLRPVEEKPPAPAVRVAPSPPEVASGAGSRASVAGIVRAFPADDGVTLGGARLEWVWNSARLLDLGFDLDVAFGSRSVRLGDLHVLLASSAAFAALRAGTGRGSAALFAGARVGLADLSGHPSSASDAAGHRVLRLWGGPITGVRLDGAIGRLTLLLVGEGGYSALGAAGFVDDASALVVQGPWLGAALGLGVRF